MVDRIREHTDQVKIEQALLFAVLLRVGDFNLLRS